VCFSEYKPKFASTMGSGGNSRAPPPRDDDRRRVDPYRRGTSDRPAQSDRYSRYSSPPDSVTARPPTRTSGGDSRDSKRG